jgi:hypothetical protein
MDFLKGEGLDLNSNYNFWRFAEVQELNKHTVDETRAEFIFEDGEIKMQENALNKHRKSIQFTTPSSNSINTRAFSSTICDD